MVYGEILRMLVIIGIAALWAILAAVCIAVWLVRHG
jgi:hypothetical protein